MTEPIKIGYSKSGTPTTMEFSPLVSGEIDDSIVTIDANECMWPMLSDAKQSEIKNAATNIDGIESVEVIEFKGDE